MADSAHVVVDSREQRGSSDGAIAELAARQHGVVAHQQLVNLGLNRAVIQYRLGLGRLHQVHRGVYAVGHTSISQSGRWMAAVLAYGPHAVLSHHSAASLWGIKPTRRRLIDVTVPRNRRVRSGTAVHLVRALPVEDQTAVDGIPVTTVARTLLDLARVIPLNALDRAVEQAERLEIFDLRLVDELIERSYRCPGVGVLKRALLAYRDRPHVTRSELERRFLDLCRNAGLPSPAVNFWLIDQEVDFLWAEQKLVVELDGRRYHQTRSAFERDRQRDAALQLAGYRVLRVTRRWLETEPEGMIATTRGLLGVG